MAEAGWKRTIEACAIAAVAEAGHFKSKPNYTYIYIYIYIYYIYIYIHKYILLIPIVKCRYPFTSPADSRPVARRLQRKMKSTQLIERMAKITDIDSWAVDLIGVLVKGGLNAA